MLLSYAVCFNFSIGGCIEARTLCILSVVFRHIMYLSCIYLSSIVAIKILCSVVSNKLLPYNRRS